MRTAYTETYKVSKTFDAPIEFVYSWCTDFREDDPKMLGSRLRRKFHEKTEKTTEVGNPRPLSLLCASSTLRSFCADLCQDFR